MNEVMAGCMFARCMMRMHEEIGWVSELEAVGRVSRSADGWMMELAR